MSVLKRRRSRTDIEQAIREVIGNIPPLLRMQEDNCGIELSAFDIKSGLLTIRLGGGCEECGVSLETFMQGIETHIKLRISEVRAVHAEIARSDKPRSH